MVNLNLRRAAGWILCSTGLAACLLTGESASNAHVRVLGGATEVRVDGRLRGTADDFDGHPQKLNLRPGVHRIALTAPDGRKASRTVDVLPGTEIELRLDFEE